MSLDIHAPEGGQLVFTDEHRQHIVDTIAPEASPSEIELFLMVCAHVQLDPLRNQIWLVPRWDGTVKRKIHKPQVGIDGLRLIAQRSGVYGGSLEAEWCGVGGVWRDVWMANEPPAAARFRVIRKDWSEPAVGVARWAEYVQTKKDGNPTQMWASKPSLMLGKCAEALALRRAFPAEMAGLYTADEMSAGVEHETRAKAIEATPIDPAVKERFDVFMALVPELQTVVEIDAFKQIVKELADEEGLPPIESFAASGLTIEHAELLVTTAETTIAQEAPSE